MKKYLKLALASVFFLSIAVMANAQAPQGGQGGPGGFRQQQPPKERAAAMAKDLGLTAEETAKVQALFEKNDAAMTKFRADVTRDDPDFRTKMTALRTAQTEELAKLLGTEKNEKYLKIQAERRAQMQAGQGQQ